MSKSSYKGSDSPRFHKWQRDNWDSPRKLERWMARNGMPITCLVKRLKPYKVGGKTLRTPFSTVHEVVSGKRAPLFPTAERISQAIDRQVDPIDIVAQPLRVK